MKRAAATRLCFLPALLLPSMAHADLAEKLRATEDAMKAQLGRNFHVRSSEMFVCAGNMGKQEFDALVDGTVSACTKALWKQYFTKRPTKPVRVYLLGDDLTYRFYARKLFNDVGVSRFGYYRPEKRALIMNISTGTGTLVHEMVHALMKPDFPQVPIWFEEGLASLYEQCRVTPDGLVGLVNWRLPFLKKGIEAKTVLPLAKLLAASREQFLDDNEGVHYAQARYFCQYLQERGALRTFYRAFRDGHASDPTGAETLEKSLGCGVSEIERAWLTWVEALEVRPEDR